MKLVMIFATSLVLGCCPVHARLGETLEQLDVRLGKGANNGLQAVGGLQEVIFRKGNINIVVQLLNGRSVYERYMAVGGSPALLDTDYETLRKNNSQGHEWKSANGTWFRDDGAMAFFNGSQIIFESKEYVALEQAQEKAKIPDVSGM